MAKKTVAKAAKVYPYSSVRKMSAAEYRHIRVNLLDKTQAEFRLKVIYKGLDRQSAYENNRSIIPPLVAAHMRLLAEHNQRPSE